MTNSSNRKIRVFASKDYCSSTSIFYRLKEKVSKFQTGFNVNSLGVVIS